MAEGVAEGVEGDRGGDACGLGNALEFALVERPRRQHAAILVSRRRPHSSGSIEPEASTLHVGEGSFAPVAPEIWNYSVSGFRVVESWLGYRMRDAAGRSSSPLDEIRPDVWTVDMTRELLELLWTLEATLATGYAGA
ncbi:MAG: type ISP restriction/modification enzyme [Trueperaceae bacterium]